MGDYCGDCGCVTFLVTNGSVGSPVTASISVTSYGGDILGGDWNIDWGDGTSTVGSIPPDGTSWSTSTQHTYYASGYYNVTLTGEADTALYGVCTFIPITDQIYIS